MPSQAVCIRAQNSRETAKKKKKEHYTKRVREKEKKLNENKFEAKTALQHRKHRGTAANGESRNPKCGREPNK